MIQLYHEYRFTSEELLEILEHFDSIFSPPFSSGVNLKQYANKLITHASFIIAKDNEQIIGIIAYYKNHEKLELYIPYFCIAPKMQGKNLGSKMLVFLSRNESQYKHISLEVLKSNILGVRFYIKNEFKIVKEQENQKYLMSKLINI